MKIEIIKEEGEFKSSSGGPRLFFNKYSLKNKLQNPLAVKDVFVFHDVGEHSGRYDAMLRRFLLELTKKKIEVVCHCIDFPGHGRSEGKRGHIDDLKEMGLDFISFINSKTGDDSKVVLFGHGVGALIICDILHNESNKLLASLSGGIFLNPAFKFKKSPINMAGKFFLNTSFSNNLKVKYRAQEMIDKNLNDEVNDQDPLFCHKLSLSTIFQIQSLGKSLRTSSYYLNDPFLVGVDHSHPVYDEALSELFCRGLEKGQFKKYFHAPHYLEGHHIGTNALKDIIKWFQNELI